jgi:hypothetical protein
VAVPMGRQLKPAARAFDTAAESRACASAKTLAASDAACRDCRSGTGALVSRLDVASLPSPTSSNRGSGSCTATVAPARELTGLGQTGVVEPGRNLGWIEPDEPAPFQVGHSLLGDEAADVALSHPEVLSELVDREQVGKWFSLWHRYLLRATKGRSQ